MLFGVIQPMPCPARAYQSLGLAHFYPDQLVDASIAVAEELVSRIPLSQTTSYPEPTPTSPEALDRVP